MSPEEELEALKKKNKELLDDLAPLKALKKTLDELGGVDAIKSAIEESSELKTKLTEKSTDVDTVRNQLTGKLTAAEKKAEALKSRIANTKVESKLKELAKEHGATWEFIEGRVKSRVKYEYNDETDALTLKVLGADGQPLMKDGKEAELSSIFDELKADDVFKKAFEVNTARSGTGSAPSGNASKGGSKDNPFVGGTIDEQTKLFRERPDYARRLQKEAMGG